MSFSFKRTITVSDTLVGTVTTANFPLLFSGVYAFLATTANGGNVKSNSGYDIVFTSDAAGSTPLNYERVSYNPTTGAVEIWVQVPSISPSAPTIIYIWYGNSSVTSDQSNPVATWDSNFAGVYHMGSGGTLSANDSTSNAHNGTISGATEAAGQVGDGASFSTASAQHIDLGTAFAFSGGVPFTISAWAQFTGTFSSAYPVVLSCVDVTSQNGWELLLAGTGGSPNGNYLFLQTFNGGAKNFAPGPYAGTAITQGSFVNIVAVYDPTTNLCHVYSNGTETANSPVNFGAAPIGVATVDLWIGATQITGTVRTNWTGVIDEVMFSDVVRTPSFITASYNNQLSPSAFYTIGVALNSQRGSIAYDQIRAANRLGAGSYIQMAASGGVTTGHVPVYDATGSLIDSGVAPGGGLTISVNGVPVA